MLYIKKASVFSLSFQLFQVDGLTPLDCSDLIIKFIIKKEKSDTDTDCVLPIQTFENPDTNLLLVQYLASQTAQLDEGSYIGALKVFRANSVNEEIWSSPIEVKKGVFNE